MRLTVKRGDELVNELRFSRGPIYIGRQIGSQVFLPDRAVSRQHTVIYTTTEGKWIVEDLDSANKTYLNNEVIHKAEIKNGDVIKIADFHVEFHLDESDSHDTKVHLGDTLHSTLHEPQIVLRQLDGSDVAPIKMPAKRCKDFSRAAEAISKSKDISGLVTSLVDTLARQFAPFHTWVAVRKNSVGPMEAAKGRKISGESVKLEEMPLASKINEAIKNRHYVFVPRLPQQQEQADKINSALIAPIICEGECYGVLYVDNSLDHEHYDSEDLDYLILISLLAGAFIRNF
jgi:pSer/pThr/pTyr-binding forkhead associated (FHA) protein